MMQSFPTLSSIFNFLVLMGILIYLLRKPVSAHLNNRSQAIEKNLQESEALREQALKMLQEYESKMNSLESEVEKILQKAKSDGEKEKERILKRAEVMAAQIVENARLGADRESMRIRKKIENQVMQKAVEKAKHDLSQNATVKDHQMFVDHFIAQLEKSDGTTAF